MFTAKVSQCLNACMALGLGLKALLALQLSELALFVFPFIRIRQGHLALGDARPTNVRQLQIQGGHVLLPLWDIFFGIDGVDRTLWNTNGTVDALIGVDGEKVGAFTETVDRTDIYTVGVLATDTGFGDNVGHDKSVVKV